MSKSDSTFFYEPAQVLVPYAAAYAPVMLGRLQDRTGSPNLRTRALAACVILGLVILTAPLAVLPVVHWLARFL